MKTKHQITLFSSDKKELNFNLPNGWEELTQKQLRYVYTVLSFMENTQAKVYILFRFGEIEVLHATVQGWHCRKKVGNLRKRWEYFTIELLDIQYLIKKLSWLDEAGAVPVPLACIGGRKVLACDILQICFEDYLKLENFYQAYLSSTDSSVLVEIYNILYPERFYNLPHKLTQAEQLSIINYYAQVKNSLAIRFSEFFTPAGEEQGEIDMLNIMNNEIRALTGGDITKERTILQMECWRALTELEAKAREAREMKKGVKHD